MHKSIFSLFFFLLIANLSFAQTTPSHTIQIQPLAGWQPILPEFEMYAMVEYQSISSFDNSKLDPPSSLSKNEVQKKNPQTTQINALEESINFDEFSVVIYYDSTSFDKALSIQPIPNSEKK